MDARTRTGIPWFFAWAAVGAGYAFGVLAILSIGIFVLAITVVVTVFLAREPRARSGLTGFISGLGLPLLYVAFLNRGGPGTVCAGQSCTEEWSPWPWLLIGSLLVVVGAALFTVVARRRVP